MINAKHSSNSNDAAAVLNPSFEQLASGNYANAINPELSNQL